MSVDALAIEVHSLSKTYRTGWWGGGFEALRDVSLDVRQGEIFALLGPNGAGKTTLIKVLLGIARRTSGRVLLLGRPAGARASRRRIGYLPEQLRLPRHHNARTALSLLGQLSGLSRREVRRRGGPLLQRVGLADWASEPLRKYSKGMLQRLGLAQALLHDPELLILDEPTDGLDPVGRNQVREVLLELKAEGTTIFINSHLLQEVELICDRVAILARGSLQRVGSVEELAAEVQTEQRDELQLELIGDDQAIDEALQGLDVPHRRRQDDRVIMQVMLKDQPAVDDCVDRLRRRGVSVVSLFRRKMTLEQAFLSVLRHHTSEQLTSESLKRL